MAPRRPDDGVPRDAMGNSAQTPIPAWFLAPHEDAEIRERCQTQATKECDKQFFKFGMCAEKHQILFSWKCADLKKELLSCVAYWGANDKYEAMREKFINEKKAALTKSS